MTKLSSFKKLYTIDQLKKNSIATVLSLPLEESIIVPVNMALDLMKQGENIIYFSFNHDSIKINKFFESAIKREENPEQITGNLAIVDAGQIGNKKWSIVIDETIESVKKDFEINFVFFDIFPFVNGNAKQPLGNHQVMEGLRMLAINEEVTPIVIKTLDSRHLITQDPTQMKNNMEKLLTMDMVKESLDIVSHSDFVVSINRNKNGWLRKIMRKIINFLLFWRKRNNFTLKVVKNRRGVDGKSARMNIDLDTSEVNIL